MKACIHTGYFNLDICYENLWVRKRKSNYLRVQGFKRSFSRPPFILPKPPKGSPEMGLIRTGSYQDYHPNRSEIGQELAMDSTNCTQRTYPSEEMIPLYKIAQRTNSIRGKNRKYSNTSQIIGQTWLTRCHYFFFFLFQKKKKKLFLIISMIFICFTCTAIIEKAVVVQCLTSSLASLVSLDSISHQGKFKKPIWTPRTTKPKLGTREKSSGK